MNSRDIEKKHTYSLIKRMKYAKLCVKYQRYEEVGYTGCRDRMLELKYRMDEMNNDVNSRDVASVLADRNIEIDI